MTEQITRLEIIDHSLPIENPMYGRTVLVSPDSGRVVTYDIQDNDRTLKVFIRKTSND